MKKRGIDVGKVKVNKAVKVNKTAKADKTAKMNNVKTKPNLKAKAKKSAQTKAGAQVKVNVKVKSKAIAIAKAKAHVKSKSKVIPAAKVTPNAKVTPIAKATSKLKLANKKSAKKVLNKTLKAIKKAAVKVMPKKVSKKQVLKTGNQTKVKSSVKAKARQALVGQLGQVALKKSVIAQPEKDIAGEKFISPLEDRVFVAQIKTTQNTTPSGLILIDSSEPEEHQKGLVLSVGPGKKNKWGKRHSMGVTKGETVLFTGYQAVPIIHAGKNYYIINESDILGVLDSK